MKKTVAILSLLAVQACAGRHSSNPEMSGASVTPPYVPHTIAFQGETLGVIAKWYTGSANNWTAIAEANPGVDPRKLRIGQVINVPEAIAAKREPFGGDFVGQGKKVEESATAAPTQVAKVAAGEVVVDAAVESAPAPELTAEETPARVDGGVTANAVSDALLYQGVLLEDVALMKEALQKGANIEYRQQNRTMLGIAAQSPNDLVVKALIEGGADVNAVDGIGHTPLMRAVDLASIPNIRALLGAKADVNYRDNEGRTPLLLAIRNQNEEVATVLLEAGADPSIADNEGNSPGLGAVESGSVSLVRALGAKKANLDLSNAGFSPLTFAISIDNVEMVRALVESGANPNVKTAADQLPLHMAIGKPEITKTLLAAKADPMARDTYDRTPLERAIRDGDLASAEALIGAGADVNAKTVNGSPLLQEARFSSNPEMVALLEKSGAVAE
ncbi:MAG: hypothetical protein RL417_1482 [Pseudomonadota bacterium]